MIGPHPRGAETPLSNDRGQSKNSEDENQVTHGKCCMLRVGPGHNPNEHHPVSPDSNITNPESLCVVRKCRGSRLLLAPGAVGDQVPGIIPKSIPGKFRVASQRSQWESRTKLNRRCEV